MSGWMTGGGNHSSKRVSIWNGHEDPPWPHRSKRQHLFSPGEFSGQQEQEQGDLPFSKNQVSQLCISLVHCEPWATVLPLEPELRGLQQTSKLRTFRLVLYYHHISLANKKVSDYLSPLKVASVWRQGNVRLTLKRKPSSQTSQTSSKMTNQRKVTQRNSVDISNICFSSFYIDFPLFPQEIWNDVSQILSEKLYSVPLLPKDFSFAQGYSEEAWNPLG